MFDLSMFDLFEALYYIIPTAAILFFCFSFVLYIYARRKNKRAPGTYTEKQMNTRRICLIVSSVIAGITVVVIAVFMLLLCIAVAFM